jgi:hypothetical protein
VTDITCPACGASFDIVVAFQSEEDRAAFDRLAASVTPLKARLMHYIALHRTAKHQLKQRKQAALLLQLLPDLERQAITWKGRDWPAPLTAWTQAIDQMLERRDAGTLELPLKGHGYLYAVLAGMADKHEAAQEAKREEDARLRPRRDTVQVRGQALEIGAALDVVYGGKDPALAAIEQRERNAAPMPAHLRARLDQLKKGTP